MPEEQQQSTPSSGGSELDPKLAAMLSYLLGIVGGIVFYVISKDSYVKFHAMQSIMLSIAMAVIYTGLMILSALILIMITINWIIYLAFFALWIMLMIKAYQGERYKLPIIGDMAEKYAK